MKILVLHGPNLNLLGKRETDVYGTATLEQINNQLIRLSQELETELVIKQSNHEGELVEIVQKAAEEGVAAIVINPAAYTHSSVAIRDAIAAAAISTVEVHLSNIYKREDFRRRSLIAPVAAGQVSGLGAESYLLGLRAAVTLARQAGQSSER